MDRSATEIGSHERTRDRRIGAGEDAPLDTELWGVYQVDTDDFTLHNRRIMGQRRAAIHGGDWMKPQEVENFRLKQCDVFGAGELLWGLRMYDMTDMVISDSHFYNIGHLADGREGHAVYLNVNGDLTVRNCLFDNLLGQAIQLVWRDHETVLPRPDYDRTIRIKNVRVRNAGMNGDRAAYPISIFNPGHSVIMRDVVVRTTKNFPPWWNHRTEEYRQSRGAILCGGVSDRTPLFDLRDFNITVRHADRAAIKLDAVDRIEIHNGHVADRGEVYREQPAIIAVGSDCPAGSITGLTGNFNIVRRGPGPNDSTVVSTGEDYEWED